MNRTILKPGKLQAPSRGGCTVDLRDISRQAKAMIDAARLEAKRIVEEARRDSERRATEALLSVQKTGFEEGLARGRAEGNAAALQEAKKRFADEQAELVKMLGAMIESFKASRERLLVEARQDCLTLAIAIASRVLDEMSDVGESASAAAVEACREALDLIGAQTDVVIRAHADDCAALERFCQQIHSGLQPARHVRLAPDERVARAGVIIETAESRIDATVNEKVRRIAEELVGDWKSRMAKLSLES